MKLSKMSRIFHTIVLKSYVRDIICLIAMKIYDMFHLYCFFRYSQRLEIRAQVADAFLSKFQLNSDEMSLLRGIREGPVTEVSLLFVRVT